MRGIRLSTILGLGWILVSGGLPAQSAVYSASDVNPQGKLVAPAADPISGEVRFSSGSGAIEMTARPLSTGDSSFLWDLVISSKSGPAGSIRGIEASTFYLSDLPCVIALTRLEANSVPCPLQVYDLSGRLLHETFLEAPLSPSLSPDGAAFAWITSDAVEVLDLRTFRARRLPRLDLFALGEAGMLAGVTFGEETLRVFGPAGPNSIPLGPLTREGVREVALSADGSAAFLLLPESVVRVDLPAGPARVVYQAGGRAEFRDIEVRGKELLVGARRSDEGRFAGSLAVLDLEGAVRTEIQGPTREIPRRERGLRDRGIPWPLDPDTQHSVGNTYGEYQYYGGAPYPHPGIDVMGSPGQPVFAVRRGVVKAILTTSGEWHWRVAVGDSAVSSTTLGYLYAHLDEPTIAVNVGDPIAEGQYLGDLVTWPVAEFHHCHFTRIEDSGLTWDGVWLSVHNPHLDVTPQMELEAPVFEPARGTDLLAFCNNQTSTYQNPQQLTGAVDIITHVGDRIVSNWVCTVQELRYTIYPLGHPEIPLVDNKLSQYFDMTCDTYGSGQIDAFLISLLYKDDSVCRTRGDYDAREFFHILTNSDGDGVYEQSDLNQAWVTTALPDGDYVIRVTATDAKGNSSTQSMTVRTANGNPSDVAEDAVLVPRLTFESVSPNPLSGEGWVRFQLPENDRVRLSLYDAAGRNLRVLQETNLEAGPHALRLEGLDAPGSRPAPGVYFLRLEGETLGSVSRKLILVR